MTSARGTANTVSDRAVPGRATVVAGLLLLSGAGSLTLEVVWSRMLKLVFGSTTLAISTILVAYMLGLALGGLLGGKLAERDRSGLRTYALLELAIGGYALLTPLFLGLYPQLNRAFLGTLPFWPAAFVRFGLSLLVFIVPTLLMGATLPVLVGALVRGRDRLGRQVGLLYGVNTLGAVAGTLGTTFVFFPTLGLVWTNAAGASLDLAAGALALFVAAPWFAGPARPAEGSRSADEGVEETPAPIPPALPRWNAGLLCYGVVGFTALVYEVAWTRALAMITGSSIHAFAATLAAFLGGIAVGSLAARRWIDRVRRPLPMYAGGIAALGAASLATVAALRLAPDAMLSLYRLVGPRGPGALLIAGFIVSVVVLLPPTLVLGALFPLVSRALAGRGRPAGATVGDVYFVNTIGAALGALAAGFVFIPRLGLGHTLNLMIALDLSTAALVLAWQTEWTNRPRLALPAAALAAGLAVLVIQPGYDQRAMTRGVYYRPWNHVDVGVSPIPMPGANVDDIVYYRDGLNTTISVHRTPDPSFRGNGKPEASLTDMPTQVLLGEIPGLFGRTGRSALLIGLASGVTAGSLALHPLQTIDVVEIEPAAVEASRFFDEYNSRPLERPGVRVLLDDGRNWIESSRQRYDTIVSEPSNPFITGVANLFTREFFKAARRALAPRGRLYQWVQLYAMDPAGLQSILAAIHSEFPYIYGLIPPGAPGDLILIAGDEPLGPTELPRWEKLSTAVRQDLERIQIFSTADLWSLVRLLPADIATIAALSTKDNTDDSMFIELHAPWWVGRALGEEHQPVLIEGGDLLGVAERSGPPLSAEEVGQLALSALLLAERPALASRLADESVRRGRAPSAVAARALLANSGERPDAVRALALLDEATTLDPGAFQPRLLRAQVRFEQNRKEDLGAVLADVDAALAARPGDFRALRLRLLVLNRLGRSAEARPVAETLLRTPAAPLDVNLWAEAAGAAAGVGDYRAACRELLFYLQRRPFSAARWKALAAWRRLAGEPDDHVREAEQNVALAQRNLILAAHKVARRQALFGSRERARRLLEEILRWNPDYGPARADLNALQ